MCGQAEPSLRRAADEPAAQVAQHGGNAISQVGRAGTPPRTCPSPPRHGEFSHDRHHDPARVGRVDRARCCRAIRLEDGALVPRGDPITYAQLGTAVREIAGGLAELGVERGDHVAILCSTRPEWTLADYGILAAGATVVPIYPTNSAEECAYVLGHSESVAVICEDAAQLAKIERVREACPALDTIVLMEGEADGTVPLAELRRMGAECADDF